MSYELITPLLLVLCLFLLIILLVRQTALSHRQENDRLTQEHGLVNLGNKLLDELDPIPQSYTLEVGSAGLERELIRSTHFDACEGSAVRVRMIRPTEDGARDLTGTLVSCDKENLTLETAEGTLTLPLSGIAYVRLADLAEDEIRRAADDAAQTR